MFFGHFWTDEDAAPTRSKARRCRVALQPPWRFGHGMKDGAVVGAPQGAR